MDAPADRVPVRFRNVVQVFRVQHERVSLLREMFARLRLGGQATDFPALREISFEARRGEVLGIIGPNGSGKSTILKLIAGVYQPTAGAVEVHGAVSPLIELTAGFHPELTGRENVFLTGALLGESRQRIRERFEAIVSFAELPEFIDAPLRQYSSGMQIRLGFAIAVEFDRPIVVIDEVLAVGDEAFQRKCIARLQGLTAAGRTIVLVSHDMAAVERVCQRVLLLNQGQIVDEGPPRKVIEHYYQQLEPTPRPVSPA